MTKYISIIVFLFIPFIYLPQKVSGACGQNPDNIILLKNGKKITESNFILARKYPESDKAILPESVCVEGTCHSHFFSGDISNIYFYEITDTAAKKEMDELIIKAKEEVIINNRNISKYLETFLYYTDLYVAPDFRKSPSLLKVLEESKSYPFPDINQISNEFTYDNCSYQRNLSYDINSGKLKINNKFEDGPVMEDDYNFFNAKIQPSESDIRKRNINRMVKNIPTPVLYSLIIIPIGTLIIVLYKINRRIKK